MILHKNEDPALRNYAVACWEALSILLRRSTVRLVAAQQLLRTEAASLRYLLHSGSAIDRKGATIARLRFGCEELRVLGLAMRCWAGFAEDVLGLKGS